MRFFSRFSDFGDLWLFSMVQVWTYCSSSDNSVPLSSTVCTAVPQYYLCTVYGSRTPDERVRALSSLFLCVFLLFFWVGDWVTGCLSNVLFTSAVGLQIRARSSLFFFFYSLCFPFSLKPEKSQKNPGYLHPTLNQLYPVTSKRIAGQPLALLYSYT